MEALVQSRGGTRQGSCLTGSDVFPRFARGSLVKRAGQDGMARGRAPWTLGGGGGGGRSQSGTEKKRSGR